MNMLLVSQGLAETLEQGDAPVGLGLAVLIPGGLGDRNSSRRLPFVRVGAEADVSSDESPRSVGLPLGDASDH